MEMVMTLIGKRLPSQRIAEAREYSTKEEMSSRMSSSSSGTKVIKKCKYQINLIQGHGQARGYKTFFMLNSTEHEISTAYKI